MPTNCTIKREAPDAFKGLDRWKLRLYSSVPAQSHLIEAVNVMPEGPLRLNSIPMQCIIFLKY